MKKISKIILTIFFVIAFVTHIFSVFGNDDKPLWWHCLYFLTYGVCGWTLFSKLGYRLYIYTISAVFPFVTHLYYAYRRFPNNMEINFIICIVVCLFLIFGFISIKNEIGLGKV